MTEAKYVVFDGMDGSGKGTQIKHLEEKLSGRVIFTREPGGTPFAEEIRKLLLSNSLAGKSTALNNFFLFWAAREELQENFVLPALQSGKHVFSDRGDVIDVCIPALRRRKRTALARVHIYAAIGLRR